MHPAENLTHAETVERARLVIVRAYRIELDLTTGPRVFRSATTVRFAAAEGASTFVDVIPDRLLQVRLNGAALDPSQVSDGARIRLDGLTADNELYVVADMAYSRSSEGLHRATDPADGEVYLYTQFEPADARRVFAVFEQPDLKAPYEFAVTVPDGWVVVSNVTATETGRTWRFPPGPPLSSYLVALAAGPYRVAQDDSPVPLGVYARRSVWDHVETDRLFATLRTGIATFERMFGHPYPFAKLDLIYAPEFPSAMENAAAITCTEDFVFRGPVPESVRVKRDKVLLHELSHMWFGDLVTMRWWNDLWLKESFADWAASAATGDWVGFATLEKPWAYAQDELPSTHPVVADIRDLEDVLTAFDGIAYAKGASAIKQLAARVGAETFAAGVSRYFERHAGGNTELADLLAALEWAGAEDLPAWSRVWLETAGVNTLRAELTVAEGTITSAAVVQTAPADHPALRPHRLAIGLYERRGGRLTRTHRVELDVDGPRTDVPELAGRQAPDLLLLNDDDLAYGKVRLDDRSRATAVAALTDLDDPLARALVWGALWDATRDAELRARDFLALGRRHVSAETHSTILSATLSRLVTTATRYAAEPAAALRDTADALLRLAGEAEDRDARLQFLRAFADVAEYASQHPIALLAEDPDVDTDLRRDLLIGYLAAGAAGTAEIEAEERADARGRDFALRARAALPVAAAKEGAWATLMNDPELTFADAREIAAGFGRVAQPRLLEPYLQRYFGSLTAMWEGRGPGIGRLLVGQLWPWPLIGPELRAAADAWLATHTDAPAPLRRVVIEHRADLLRALAARSF